MRFFYLIFNSSLRDLIAQSRRLSHQLDPAVKPRDDSGLQDDSRKKRSIFQIFFSFIFFGLFLTSSLYADVTVSNTTDVVNGNTSSVANLQASDGGDGISLREAVEAVNADSGVHTILFDAVVFPSATPATITLSSNLTVLSAAEAKIDGVGAGVVIKNGSVNVSASNFVIREIQIQDHSSVGIQVSGAGYGLIEECVIGEASHAIRFQTSSNELSVVRRNYLGVDRNFNLISNTSSCVRIAGTAPNTNMRVLIGGPDPQDRNYIGGFSPFGINVTNEFDEISVFNNYIGTNENGDDIAPGRGIRIQIGQWNQLTIGSPGKGNHFGHSDDGITIQSTVSSSNTTIQGNIFGTNANGDNLATTRGIRLSTIGTTLVGGSNPGEGNTFGYCMMSIDLEGPVPSSTGANYIIQGNSFGTNTSLQNLGAGTQSHVFISPSLSVVDPMVVQIGGTNPGEGNLFAFAENEAISLASNAAATILGNFIGTDASGANLGNGDYGVRVVENANGLASYVIGAGDPAIDNTGANVIANASQYGIFADGPNIAAVQFRGNSIHSNVLGAIELANGASGGISAPTLISVIDSVVSGSGAEPNALIDVYSNPLGESQARQWVAAGAADSLGNFSFSVGTILNGNITVTQTNSAQATSPLSNAIQAINQPGIFVNTVTDVLDAPDTSSVLQLKANPGPDLKISLREAILAINNDASENEIDFDDNAFPAGSSQRLFITNSALPAITGLNTTMNADRVILDGSLLGQSAGLQLAAENFHIQGIKVEKFDASEDSVGIEILDPAYGVIEGCTIGRCNTGIEVKTLAIQNTIIRNNFIGTNSNGDDLGGTQHGIHLSNSSFNCIIGAEDPAIDNSGSNVIAHYNEYGIFSDKPTALNRFRGNSIHSNTLGAIGLFNGTNGNINPPNLANVVSSIVLGSGAGPSAIIDVYANPPGESQARQWIASGIADSSGNFSFTANVPLGDQITVTQTSSTQGTSALSNAKEALGLPDTLVVNTAADILDGDVSDALSLLLNPGPDGKISLREAILTIENNTSATIIEFDPVAFPQSNPQAIFLNSPLVPLTRSGFTIDAIEAGVILDGSNLTNGNGLILNGSGIKVKGLTIRNFPENGIKVIGGTPFIGGFDSEEGNTIISNAQSGIHLVGGLCLVDSNLIGTNENRDNLGNFQGVFIGDGVVDVLLGVALFGEGNIIANSVLDQVAIELSPAASSATVRVQNNFIGTDSNGTPMGSGQHGIRCVVNGDHTVSIGGGSLSETGGNTIGFAALGGVFFENSTTPIKVEGNRLGVTASGIPVPNLGGVGIVNASNITVGSPDPSTDNTRANIMAHNLFWGLVGFGSGAKSNTFRGNKVHSNGVKGLELLEGANNFISPPAIDFQGTTLVGQSVLPNATIDVYLNDPGEDEADEYLGSVVSDGNGDFAFPIPAQFVQQDHSYTATQTILGNTSATARKHLFDLDNFTFNQVGEVGLEGNFLLSGTAVPFSTIILYIDGQAVATKTADKFGNYFFNLVIELGQTDFRIEMLIDNEVFELEGFINYEGASRIYAYDRHYRTTGFVRELENSDLNVVLNDFSTIQPTDGEDYEANLYDSANNFSQITNSQGTQQVSNNKMNETTAIGNFRTNIVYDLLGRLTGYDETINSVTTKFRLTWNMRDQLTLVEQSTNGGSTWNSISSYEYYPTGMRSSKFDFDSGLSENFYGPNMMIHEIYGALGTSGPETFQPVKEFVYENLDRPIVMFTNADNNFATGTISAREAYFYQCNAKGDVYALTDESGDIVERYEYDLFGTTTVTNANFQPIDENGNLVLTQQESKSAIGNPFQFSGAYKDDETCFMQMRFRYYDSRLRGFLSRDPLEDDTLGNLYAFVENNPGTYIDPMGLLLVAIDGSDSKNWLKEDKVTGLYNSHVKNFYDAYDAQEFGPDYKNAKGELKIYSHGPSTSGSDTGKIHRRLKKYIKRILCENPDQDVNIVGFSRGGHIGVELARELQKEGIRVNFIGGYDPVDMTMGYGRGEQIPSNVDNAAMAYLDSYSRPSFNRVRAGVEDPSKTNLEEREFRTTHSGIGGEPNGGDKYMVREPERIGQSVLAGQWMVEQARKSGLRFKFDGPAPVLGGRAVTTGTAKGKEHKIDCP